jgi:nitrite reductase (NO-forming)
MKIFPALRIICAIVLAGSTFSLSILHAAEIAGASTQSQTVKRFVLKTGIAGAKMAYLDENENANPVLRVVTGDTIEIAVSSGEGAEHNFVIPELGIKSSKFNNRSGPVTVRFLADRPGRFTYFCTISGHRKIGMEGILEVIAPPARTSPG